MFQLAGRTQPQLMSNRCRSAKISITFSWNLVIGIFINQLPAQLQILQPCTQRRTNLCPDTYRLYCNVPGYWTRVSFVILTLCVPILHELSAWSTFKIASFPPSVSPQIEARRLLQIWRTRSWADNCLQNKEQKYLQTNETFCTVNESSWRSSPRLQSQGVQLCLQVTCVQVPSTQQIRGSGHLGTFLICQTAESHSLS